MPTLYTVYCTIAMIRQCKVIVKSSKAPQVESENSKVRKFESSTGRMFESLTCREKEMHEYVEWMKILNIYDY